MDFVALADRIVKATCHIVIIHEQKVVSAGSGVLVEGGKLLTAGHVVFQRVGRIYPGDLMLRGAEGVISRPPLNFLGLPAINVGLPQLVRPVTLDITLADFPETPPGMQPLPLAKQIAPRGTEVLIAGLTDEVPLAVDLDWSLEVMNPDMNSARDYLGDLGNHFVRAPMVKRAMIGCTTKVEVKDEGVTALEAASYVLDNDLTYGGSGGPVMNLQGELLGIVTRKATTAARELRIQTLEQGTSALLQKIFSGSGLALSHRFITTIPGVM